MWLRNKEKKKPSSIGGGGGGGHLILWSCFSFQGPGNLAKNPGIMDMYLANCNWKNLATSAKKLQLGCGWIIQKHSDAIYTSKSTQKWFSIHRNMVFYMAMPVSWLKPHQKPVNESLLDRSWTLEDVERFRIRLSVLALYSSVSLTFTGDAEGGCIKCWGDKLLFTA